MTEPTPKPAEDEDKAKGDPAATRADSARPAPRWTPDPKAEDDDDLFNDMPV